MTSGRRIYAIIGDRAVDVPPSLTNPSLILYQAASHLVRYRATKATSRVNAQTNWIHSGDL